MGGENMLERWIELLSFKKFVKTIAHRPSTFGK